MIANIEKCQFKGKPCPFEIATTEGDQSREGTTWWYIRRLSNLGNSKFMVAHTGMPFVEVRHIETAGKIPDFVFKQTSPRRIAELYSGKKLGPFTRHSCSSCTKGIYGVLSKLDLEPKIKV